MKLFVAVVVACSFGCGRFDFDPTTAGDGRGGDDGGGADAPSTGPAGSRYLIEVDANGKTTLAAGANGNVAVAESFQGAITIAHQALVGQAMFESVGFVWLDPTGAPASHTVLDSTSVCHVRELGGGGANGGVVTAGYTQAGATTPADGPCALATGHQDGLSLGVAPGAVQSPVAHVISSTFNTQAWYAHGFADGTVAISGVYGDKPMLGTKSFPQSPTDENPFVARVDPATGEARWIDAVVSADSIEAGAIDTNGDEACATGTFANTTTVFGTPLVSAGMADVWVARLDVAGNAKWVRALGSIGEDRPATTIAATSDGGCTVAFEAPNDLTIDTTSLPAAGGGVAVVRFDSLGHAGSGTRAPIGLALGRLGDRLFAAIQCRAACTFGTANYMPMAGSHDIVIAALDPGLRATFAGLLTGGASTLVRFAAIPPDALAVSFTATTFTTFGSLTLSPSTPSVSALAVMGVPAP